MMKLEQTPVYPHLYLDQFPVKGCKLCGFGPGAIHHNTYEVERFQRSVRELREANVPVKLKRIRLHPTTRDRLEALYRVMRQIADDPDDDYAAHFAAADWSKDLRSILDDDARIKDGSNSTDT